MQTMDGQECPSYGPQAKSRRSQNMRISLLVASSTNRTIGRDGDLPWRLSADLKRFKRLTMGHPILMGRKTLESIGRLLPGRQTIVLTRNSEFEFPGAIVVTSWDAALAKAAESLETMKTAGEPELFVVGGAEIYRLALPFTDRLYLTRVHAEIEGDTFFPELDDAQWHVVEEEKHTADAKNEYDYSFVTLDRATKSESE